MFNFIINNLRRKFLKLLVAEEGSVLVMASISMLTLVVVSTATVSVTNYNGIKLRMQDSMDLAGRAASRAVSKDGVCDATNFASSKDITDCVNEHSNKFYGANIPKNYRGSKDVYLLTDISGGKINVKARSIKEANIAPDAPAALAKQSNPNYTTPDPVSAANCDTLHGKTIHTEGKFKVCVDKPADPERPTGLGENGNHDEAKLAKDQEEWDAIYKNPAQIPTNYSQLDYDNSYIEYMVNNYQSKGKAGQITYTSPYSGYTYKAHIVAGTLTIIVVSTGNGNGGGDGNKGK